MYESKVNPNVLSLTDTALTLIVAFMVTLPAILWSGMDVDAAKASAGISKTITSDDEILIVSISRKLIYINGKITAVSRLEKKLITELDRRKSREIIVAPDGDVMLGRIVKVFDIARMAGANKLILLDTGVD